MKIMHILPEFEDGGVERLVPVFANGQAALGHQVTVVSHGGKLVSSLDANVRHIKMPVHRKNPFIGMACAARIASVVRREKIQIIHAHSRVPGWISYFARKFAPGVKFIYTVHARFSTMKFISVWPISKADGVTCVSNCVKDHFKDWLPMENMVRVIYNALPGKVIPWRGSEDSGTKHLLFAGRLSEKKGPMILVNALAKVKDGRWCLDMLGDGPLMPKLKELIKELGLEEKITLHGFSNNVAEAISKSDLVLFPSLDEEGLGLVLAEAFSAGAPVIASDISATRELTLGGGCERELLPPTNIAAWAEAIDSFLAGDFLPKLKLAITLPTDKEMVSSMLEFYREVLGGASAY